MNALAILQTSPNYRLLPTNAADAEKSRLKAFIGWLDAQGVIWHNADLAAYRDYLLTEGRRKGGGLSPATVQAHLATIRGQYTKLLIANSVRDELYSYTPAAASAADKKAYVDEMLKRLQNAVHPTTAPVKTVKKQDETDAKHLRLKRHQVEALTAAPRVDTLTGLRDTAMIALTVCTGIREAELCALDVDDLRQRFEGELSLYIRHGKGNKQRLIPYGALDWCLLYVDRWLEVAGIQSGAVFRGFYKGSKAIRPERITTRAVNDILNKYPILIEGVSRKVKPHDLRRTYARLLYDAGVETSVIQENLGHEDIKTTKRYIGKLNAEQRRPPAMISPPNEISDLNARWTI